jgi:hypothetical protein
VLRFLEPSTRRGISASALQTLIKASSGGWHMDDSVHVGVVVPYAIFAERRQRRQRIATELKQNDRPTTTPDDAQHPDPVDPNAQPKRTEVR